MHGGAMINEMSMVRHSADDKSRPCSRPAVVDAQNLLGDHAVLGVDGGQVLHDELGALRLARARLAGNDNALVHLCLSDGAHCGRRTWL